MGRKILHVYIDEEVLRKAKAIASLRCLTIRDITEEALQDKVNSNKLEINSGDKKSSEVK
jgi:hypothetical protein